MPLFKPASFMTCSATALALLSAAVLTACGGGGAGGSSSITFSPSSYSATWTPTPANCSAFVYAPTFYASNASLTFSPSTLNDTVNIYSDAACTQQVATLTENYNLVYSPTSVGGMPIAAQIQFTFSSAKFSVTGTNTVPLNRQPDGSQTGGNHNDICGINGNGLYGGNKSSPKDGNGYPTQFSATPMATR